MSDIKQILQLPGAGLDSIDQDADEVTLKFSRVYIVQEMEGAFEDSLWEQAVNLVIRDMRLSGDLPHCPCVIDGGDLVNNIFTYRDHAPLPIDWHGDVSCTLKTAGGDASFIINGSSMQIEQIANPRYLRHIRKDQDFRQE